MKKLGLVALLAAVGAWFVAGSRRQKLVGRFTSVATRTLEPKEYDDATLKDKVESELFRDEHEVKGAININAQEGVVQLRGVEKTEKIQGVREVESLLHTPGTEAPMHH